MRRWTKAAAVAATTAVATAAAAQLSDVTGYTTTTCSGEDLVYSFDSVQEACRAIGIKAYVEWDVSDECRICDDDSLPPDPPGPGVWVPPCPRGQHGHGWDCHANHVCGDDEIGGGDEDCEACQDGYEPNAAQTACVSPYKVARCERRLDIAVVGWILPRHPNVLAEAASTEIQRGFFPTDEEAAEEHAKAYIRAKMNPLTPDPEPVFVPSVVREDSDQGTCEYEEDVTSSRYETVKDRMLNSVNTRDPWHEYHAIVRNSIMWADEVLQ